MTATTTLLSLVYASLQVAHDPVESPQRFQDEYDPSTCPDVGQYAMNAVVDEAVKNVTEALKAKGMWDNTLLVR